jgi:penicillin-binding protein 1A
MSGKKQKTKKPKYKKWLVIFWLAVLSPFIGLGVLLLIAMAGDLPDTETLANPKTNLATEVYTGDKVVIGRYYRENRSDVGYDNLPTHLTDALLATEDVRFRSHSGIDFKGLIRAGIYMGSKGGGSTLTQQLAKMLFTKKYDRTGFWERVVMQKPKEWIIASRLEKQYTKDEIISMYLNRYDFLNQAVGIKSAAYIYFNKPVDSLKVEECAMLVGMLKNSSFFNPLRYEERVQKRRNTVLSQMAKYEYVTEDEADSLKALPLGLDYQRVSHDEGMAPYFREILRGELKKILGEEGKDGNVITKSDGSRYDLYADGLKVYTTIDSRMQEYAEWSVEQHMSAMLQDEFNRDLKKRRAGNWPFYNGIASKDKAAILNRAKKQSSRYKMLTGQLCPSCNRPAFYIQETKNDSTGADVWHCNEEKEGCGHQWHITDEDSIDVIFERPVPMKVFSHWGDIDTLLSPMDSIKYNKSILHAGLMSIHPSTGHVKAWVGGVDYKYFQYDNVYQSRRQVGSTFKPFVYATAIKLGLHNRCDELPNQKICIEMPDGQPQWCPDNSDFEYGDMCSLEYGLANSINTITAKLIKEMSPDPVVLLAHDLGIKNEIPAVPSIALGVAELSLFEMVAANSALVNRGIYIEPTFIMRIEDKHGTVIYEAEPEISEALDEVTAYTTVKMMKGVVDGAYSREKNKRTGTGLRLRGNSKKREYDGVRQPMAGKTGTTQNNTDGWFMGLTPDLVTGVWVGAQDPSVRFSTTSLGQGANTALPIYGYYIKKVYGDESIDISQEDFEKPESLKGTPSMDCEEYYETSKSVNFGDDSDEDSEELFNE